MRWVAINALLNQCKTLRDRDLLRFVLACGCNLRCSCCAIKVRRAPLDGIGDFTGRFFEGLAERELISGVALVGDEPLLPTAWPFTPGTLPSGGVLDLAEDQYRQVTGSNK